MSVTMRAPKQKTHVPCGRCDGTGKRETWNGAWLRWKREKANVGLREFARKVGVQHSVISEIESNARACPARILDAYQALRASR